MYKIIIDITRKDKTNTTTNTISNFAQYDYLYH